MGDELVNKKLEKQMGNLFFSEQKPKKAKRWSPTAIQKLNWKDSAIDKLIKLGFKDVNASGTASSNIILITDTKENLENFSNYCYNLNIIHANIKSCPWKHIGFLTLGKRNLRAFGLIN